MKDYISPDISLLAIASSDIITASDDMGGASGGEILGGLNQNYSADDSQNKIDSFEYKW